MTMTDPMTALGAIRLAVQGDHGDDVAVAVSLACGSYPYARIEVTVTGASPEQAVAKLWAVLRQGAPGAS